MFSFSILVTPKNNLVASADNTNVEKPAKLMIRTIFKEPWKDNYI